MSIHFSNWIAYGLNPRQKHQPCITSTSKQHALPLQSACLALLAFNYYLEPLWDSTNCTFHHQLALLLLIALRSIGPFNDLNCTYRNLQLSYQIDYLAQVSSLVICSYLETCTHQLPATQYFLYFPRESSS